MTHSQAINVNLDRGMTSSVTYTWFDLEMRKYSRIFKEICYNAVGITRGPGEAVRVEPWKYKSRDTFPLRKSVQYWESKVGSPSAHKC